MSAKLGLVSIAVLLEVFVLYLVLAGLVLVAVLGVIGLVWVEAFVAALEPS